MALGTRRTTKSSAGWGWLCFCFKDDPVPPLARAGTRDVVLRQPNVARGNSQPAQSTLTRPSTSAARVVGEHHYAERHAAHRNTDLQTPPRRRNSRATDEQRRRDPQFRQSVRAEPSVEPPVVVVQPTPVKTQPRPGYRVECPWTAAEVGVVATQPQGPDKQRFRFLCPICFKHMDSRRSSRRDPALRVLRQLHLSRLHHRLGRDAADARTECAALLFLSQRRPASDGRRRVGRSEEVRRHAATDAGETATARNSAAKCGTRTRGRGSADEELAAAAGASVE